LDRGYDRGYKIGVYKLPSELQLLWYYIDFTIYVDNGGPGGFLYNKSPDIEDINHYAPYVKSWRFFNYNNLADLVEKYNDQYLKAYGDRIITQKDRINHLDTFLLWCLLKKGIAW
jgi:hypothetical protein